MILVLMTNLLVGLGLTALGLTMLRRTERVWVGVRVPRNEEEVARVRRANSFTAPWLLLLGGAEALSAIAGAFLGAPPIALAVAGLVLLLLSIVVIAAAALLSR
jgi:hypothetical protein